MTIIERIADEIGSPHSWRIPKLTAVSEWSSDRIPTLVENTLIDIF